jgi:hypothetical protein
VKEYWEKEYKDSVVAAVPPLVEDAIDPKGKRPNSFRVWQKEKRAPMAVQDEYDRYINQPRLDVGDNFDPRSWWQEPTQQSQFPNLSKMALDFEEE